MVVYLVFSISFPLPLLAKPFNLATPILVDGTFLLSFFSIIINNIAFCLILFYGSMYKGIVLVYC